MPLNAKHKAYIESTISCRFDDLPDRFDPLRMEIFRITEALHTHNESDRFSRIFQNPRLISRIQDSGPLNLGEAREYIIEYTDKVIVNAANRIGKNAQDLGWDRDIILTMTQEKGDHNEPLISEYVPVLPLYLSELKGISPFTTRTPSSAVTSCSFIEPMMPKRSIRPDELQEGLKNAIQAREALRKILPGTVRIAGFTVPKPGERINHSNNSGRGQ